MRNKINFISGETYSLAEIFSGERRIIIPDLQRDYCWGEVNVDNRKDLVGKFVGSLMQEYEDGGESSNGLLYGYEAPANHIQLCDGQQRITTLFLLIGMLNRRLGDNSLRHYLITDYEYLQDDREPYLNYAIRESSLYFLSDLVCHFFINETSDEYHVAEIKDIENSRWFFNEYREDPSIQSMLSALSKIEELLEPENMEWIRGFSDYLMNKVTFMYYDLENRKNGEETFVVINTTGEPLSAAQNMKPLVISAKINQNCAGVPSRWEEIKNWFWKKRIEDNGNDTADAGFGEFLRWVAILESEDKSYVQTVLKLDDKDKAFVFPYESVSFDTIYAYWKSVRFLFETWAKKDKLSLNYLSPAVRAENGQRMIDQVDSFLLLPLVAYCNKWQISDPDDRGLWRLFKFLENLVRIDRVTKAVNDVVFDAIQLARTCRDVADYPANSSGISKIILSDEEMLKLKTLKNSGENRIRVEEAFWRAQDSDVTVSHKIWAGEIMPMLQWSLVNDVLAIEAFEKYLDCFDKVFQGNCDACIDKVRRALLAKGLPNYPKVFHGNTNHSFGWEWSDWKVLINESPLVFKSFFDKLIAGTTCDAIIAQCPPEAPWYEFVHFDYLLAYCERKNIQKSDSECFLIKKKYATEGNYISVLNMHLLKYLEKKLQSGWTVSSSGDCVIVKNGNQEFRIKHINQSKHINQRIWLVRTRRNGVELSAFPKISSGYDYPEVIKSCRDLV